MRTCLVTGSAGLVGSACVRHFAGLGMRVIGVDNDMRAYFFGEGATTAPNAERLKSEVDAYVHAVVDVRDFEQVENIVRATEPELVIHTAAQPSHDWAAREPLTDFSVNAVGTVNLLEAVRRHAPEATFVFTSTNKVYGDTPNSLPLLDKGFRLELPQRHRWYNGIDTSMSIDQSTHSVFGASKVAADVMVQEYGRYFGMKTVVFRGGCLTGAAHAGAELHGFLSYLMDCVKNDRPYTVYGHGKQVRDNIHAEDVASAFAAFHASPIKGGCVYNLGGGRKNSCSVIEAIALCEEVTDKQARVTFDKDARIGDHLWWITDLSEFELDFDWVPSWSLLGILTEMA
ncbi:WcaG Nucleoside-diphosphate-sugar epimerases [uncultured Caudovirales phage]|uniref:WcaG Nucleoside-diphosphate-sugar epimerases n=1 Tax=uncultured Caudovirales phage TaxID=2100421 RepID=A0A6J5RVX6_9CAUD|nr:WcaG Nucleoside-diphosphate-sugar epimerases [uncultured Caudovirales phage]